MNDELQRTDLKLYAQHALLTTLVVFVLPLGIASWLARLDFHLPFLLTTFACATLSVVFGRVGAKLWQGRPGSRDVVFDDLLLWGYLRRLWLQRCILKHVERLALTRDDPHNLSHQEHLEVLKKLARSIETGDPFTHGHCDRVARHAYMIARAMKLPKSTCEKIRLAAALHDVGKIRTPRHIITKPGRLDDDEYEIIKRHPVDGAAMIAELGDPELEAIVRHHHERMDGTGYPHRLSGDQIPLGAAIIAVADTFDAITSLRPYRAARRHKDAIAILHEAGTQLHPDVVRAFVTYYTGRRGIRLWVSISPMLPGALEHSLAGVQRLAASTAVVAGTAAVVAGGALLPGVVFEKTNAAGTKVAHGTVTGAQPTGKGATGNSGPSQSPAQPSSKQKGAGAGPKGHKKSHRGAGSKSKESKHKDDSRPEARDDKGKDKDEDNSGPESGDDDSSGSGSGGDDDSSGSGSGSDEDNSGPGSGGDDDSSGSGSGGGDSSGSGSGGGDSSGSGSGGGDDSSGSGSGDDGNSGPGGGRLGPRLIERRPPGATELCAILLPKQPQTAGGFALNLVTCVGERTDLFKRFAYRTPVRGRLLGDRFLFARSDRETRGSSAYAKTREGRGGKRDLGEVQQ